MHREISRLQARINRGRFYCEKFQTLRDDRFVVTSEPQSMIVWAHIKECGYVNTVRSHLSLFTRSLSDSVRFRAHGALTFPILAKSVSSLPQLR